MALQKADSNFDGSFIAVTKRFDKNPILANAQKCLGLFQTFKEKGHATAIDEENTDKDVLVQDQTPGIAPETQGMFHLVTLLVDDQFFQHLYWLVVYLHLRKIWKSVGIMTFPIYGKSQNSMVPVTTKQFKLEFCGDESWWLLSLFPSCPYGEPMFKSLLLLVLVLVLLVLQFWRVAPGQNSMEKWLKYPLSSVHCAWKHHKVKQARKNIPRKMLWYVGAPQCPQWLGRTAGYDQKAKKTPTAAVKAVKVESTMSSWVGLLLRRVQELLSFKRPVQDGILWNSMDFRCHARHKAHW